MSPSWFSCGSSIEVELEFINIGFQGGGKLENQEKNCCRKARTHNKLNPHHTGLPVKHQAIIFTQLYYNITLKYLL